jgi:hypothetical protein
MNRAAARQPPTKKNDFAVHDFGAPAPPTKPMK